MIEKLGNCYCSENKELYKRVNEAIDRVNKIIAETEENIKNNKESKNK